MTAVTTKKPTRKPRTSAEKLAALEREVAAQAYLAVADAMTQLSSALLELRDAPTCPVSKDGIAALMYLVDHLASEFEGELSQDLLEQVTRLRWADRVEPTTKRTARGKAPQTRQDASSAEDVESVA